MIQDIQIDSSQFSANATANAQFNDINRFRALIQPIKDLASTWEIDIADSLDEYLEELSRLTFTVSAESEEMKLNFAEAALLIQGSTNVYSKKVEYLYQLVLKSLEYITSKKSNILTSENGAEGEEATSGDGAQNKKNRNANKGDDFDYYSFGNETKYLVLDHIIEEGKNIDLVRSKLPGSELNSSHLSQRSLRNSSIGGDPLTCLATDIRLEIR